MPIEHLLDFSIKEPAVSVPEGRKEAVRVSTQENESEDQDKSQFFRTFWATQLKSKPGNAMDYLRQMMFGYDRWSPYYIKMKYEGITLGHVESLLKKLQHYFEYAIKVDERQEQKEKQAQAIYQIAADFKLCLKKNLGKCLRNKEDKDSMISKIEAAEFPLPLVALEKDGNRLSFFQGPTKINSTKETDEVIKKPMIKKVCVSQG